MRKTCLASLLLLPALAQAHPGHDASVYSGVGFVAGVLHPFTGFDHLLGVLAAGLLMGWLPSRLRWPTCAAFLGLSGITHVLWVTPEASAANFALGLMLSSATLLAASMATNRVIANFTSAAGRSRI